MKKICLLTESRYKGGLDTFVKELIGNWPNSEDEFSFLANKSHPGMSDILNALNTDANLSNLSTPYTKILDFIHSDSKQTKSIIVKKVLRAAYMVAYFPIFVPLCIIFLTIAFKRSAFDELLVVNGGHPGSLACRLAPISWVLSGKKGNCIYNVHNSPVKFGTLRSIPEWFLDQGLVLFSSAIVTVSKSAYEDFKHCPNIYKSKKLSVVHNGISDPLETDKGLRGQYNGDSPKFCLMLSTFEARKGHKFLLNSFAAVLEELPELKLQIHGQGTCEETETIKNYIGELGLENNVELNSFAKDPFEVLKDSYMLLAPSQEYESFGLTLLEAMAMKVPFIATSVGGMIEVGQHSCGGYFCENTDKVCFTNRIISLVKNSDLRREKGLNGRKYFEKNFRATDMAKKYHSILNAK
jgi:glycosyltransferase involved in cell wall biosynthesis